jgi:hypothetical protein
VTRACILENHNNISAARDELAGKLGNQENVHMLYWYARKIKGKI